MCVKALLKKWDNLLRKLFQTFSKNKELLKRFGTFEKMGKFIKKTVSKKNCYVSLEEDASSQEYFHTYPTTKQIERVKSHSRLKSQDSRLTRVIRVKKTQKSAFYLRKL